MTWRLKAAETDATKRALATFGNPFGLALYDKDQAHVTKPAPRAAAAPASEAPSSSDESPAPAATTAPAVLILRVAGAERTFAQPETFQDAVLSAIRPLTTLEALYAFWEQNLDSFRLLRDGREGEPKPCADRYAAIRTALQTRARAIAEAARGSSLATPSPAAKGDEPAPLAIPKEKRIRDKAHLAFVAAQPCLVCGRRPAQAHHLKFAQSRAMSLKVSDEFTLPLCNVHHDQLHRTGDERAWWARSGIIDPLKLAARLWAASRGHVPPDPEHDPGHDHPRLNGDGQLAAQPGPDAAAPG